MRKHLLFSVIQMSALTAIAQPIDFSQINDWTGTGPNRAALVIQFNTGEAQANPGALVWGYRWEDGATPNGVDLVKAVAGSSERLRILIQMTGDMGYTLDGVGYCAPGRELLHAMTYDLDGAAEDPRISFGFYEPNTYMGQTSAPGAEAADFVAEAILDALDTHVILHPIDYTEYGYPAYDYDWWDIDDYAAGIWNSGWYDGYWSYWTGQEGELEHLGYSGLGMSSVYLKDGDMHGWKYISFSEDDPDWLHPVYVGGTTSSACIPASDDDTAAEYYSPSGLRLAAPPATGLYLERRGGRTVKRIANTK